MAVLAGMIIGVGCLLYLTVGGVLGAVLFSVGLMTVCLFQLELFTGQAWKLSTGEIKPLQLLEIWVENFIGVVIIAVIAIFIPGHENLQASAAAIIQNRITARFVPSIILGIPCGMLMTFAVKVPAEHPMRLFYIMFCVVAFIVCGFYHCVADMFYTFVGATQQWQAWLNVIAVTIGNVIGCNIYPLLTRRK